MIQGTETGIGRPRQNPVVQRQSPLQMFARRFGMGQGPQPSLGPGHGAVDDATPYPKFGIVGLLLQLLINIGDQHGEGF